MIFIYFVCHYKIHLTSKKKGKKRRCVGDSLTRQKSGWKSFAATHLFVSETVSAERLVFHSKRSMVSFDRYMIYRPSFRSQNVDWNEYLTNTVFLCFVPILPSYFGHTGKMKKLINTLISYYIIKHSVFRHR